MTEGTEVDDVAEKAPRSTKAVIALVARYVLLAAVLGFAVVYFSTQWEAVTDAITQIPVIALVGSFAVMLAGMVAGMFSWVVLLNGLGHQVPVARGAQVMLVGQLGKYVPGSVWGYIMQMELGRQYGIARARVLVTTLYAAGIGVIASLILGSLALPTISRGHPELLWLFALLPVGLIFLHPKVMTALSNVALKLFKRPPLEHEVRYRTILASVGWALLSYLLYGVHLWLLVIPSAEDPSPTLILLLAGALSLGFTASLFAFFLPSGAGVREAVVIGVLSIVLPLALSSALSLVSRAMFTAGDLLTAGVAVLVVVIMRRRLHSSDVASAEYADVADDKDSASRH